MICLDMHAVGKRHKLYAKRPGPELNRVLAWASSERASVIDSDDPDAEGSSLSQPEEIPALVQVQIHGVIEQRAGYHEPCAGWSDGHDAIAERLIAAMQTSDVFIEFDSPGGAAAGLEEAVNRVLRAKAELGRRITGYANEMIGSAAFWWAACVCDEIYAPKAGMIGSIGSRGAHESCSEALKMNGYKVTYFAFPGPGKVAFAPELELSELGKQRGNRDVTICGEAFVKAVCSARGLKRKAVIELDADMLHGPAALEFGLIDGIAPIEEVITYAAALAENSKDDEADNMDARNTQRQFRLGSEDPNKPGAGAEDPNKTDPEKPGSQAAAGDDDDDDHDHDDDADEDGQKCGKCATVNDKDAKYCDNCGGKMAASSDDDDNDDDDDDDDDSPDTDDSAEDPNEPKPGEKNRNQPPAPDRDNLQSSSLAEIVGLKKGASSVAIKTAVISYVKLGRFAMKLTDTQNANGAIGGLKAMAEEAAQVAETKQHLAAAKKREQYAERMGLLKKLAAANLPGYQRGDLLTDKVVKGKRLTVPTQMYAEMKLDTLRGFVEGKVKNAKPGRTNPFEASRTAAEDAQLNAFVEEAAASPEVKNISISTTATTEQLARSRAALKAANFIH